VVHKKESRRPESSMYRSGHSKSQFPASDGNSICVKPGVSYEDDFRGLLATQQGFLLMQQPPGSEQQAISNYCHPELKRNVTR
jgi:hypothetical protein